MIIYVKENGTWTPSGVFTKEENVFQKSATNKKINEIYVPGIKSSEELDQRVSLSFKVLPGSLVFNSYSETLLVRFQLRNSVNNEISNKVSYVSGEEIIEIPDDGGDYHLEFLGLITSEDNEDAVNFDDNELITSFDYFNNDLYKLKTYPIFSSSILTTVPDTLPTSVTSLSYAFYNTLAFNQNLSTWNTSNVTDMHGMFFKASAFNKSLLNWDTSNVTDMRVMFYEATSFNQDLSTWDTSSVTNMSNMFQSATSFNQDISDWDVSNVADMSGIFVSAEVFNQDLSSWNTANVTVMDRMFQFATMFNQNISGWDVTNVISWVGFNDEGVLDTNNKPPKFR